MHCISPCRSLIRTVHVYITRFIHYPSDANRSFWLLECPAHFKTLKSVIFGTVSQQFIHILFRKSSQSFLEKISIGCREHIQDWKERPWCSCRWSGIAQFNGRWYDLPDENIDESCLMTWLLVELNLKYEGHFRSNVNVIVLAYSMWFTSKAVYYRKRQS